ncbi:InlB B-repeat-containing protein [Bifidobacterium castoris]|uniref:Leucine-rich repeat (LRR) protein n=1 Tax=Bifidobacterium castoris TaxID=2306972 RepID=A0A430F4J7_9BIFI|nr:InlB B-repeat-containing protein [Bifidobacterium castoris]RSX44709.1 leucine-rich repeat (LRR) protein [Bifidobacterium castoris]
MAEALGPIVNNWRVRVNAVVKTTEGGRCLIRAECYWQAANGYSFAGLSVNGVAVVDGQSASGAKTGVTVGANGQVGMCAKEVWVSRGQAAKSVLCSATATVTGYAAGSSKSDVRVSVPALAAHTVRYDANGGSGAPGNQTKWWGSVLTLSSTRPSRSNYTFMGWSTTRNGSVAYQPGDPYGSDKDLTLYAVWKLKTSAPTITSFTAQRVNTAGEADESSASVRLTAVWKCDTAGDSTNAVQSLKLAYQTASGSWTEFTPSASGASGTTTITIDGLSADETWRFRASLKDKYTTVTSYTTVGPQRFLLDFSADGKGIGIGVGAPVEGVAIAGDPVTVNGCNVPHMFKGTKVVSPSASSNRHDLFTADQWAAIVGENIDAASAVVFVANGDLRANNISLTGAGWNQDDKRWYVFCSSSTGAPFRVNYMIFI